MTGAAPGPTRGGAAWPEESRTTQVRRDVVPAALAASAPAAAAAPVASAPGGSPPAVPPTGRDPERGDERRRRGGRVLAVVALLVALVAGSVLVYDQLGRGGGATAADPATTRSAPSASGRSTSEPGSASPDDDPSTADPSSGPSSDAPSPSATRTTSSPSPSPTSTGDSGRPTEAQLEDVITTYYGLVPDDTDAAWPLLTSTYQRTTSGGRQSYERFWDQVDRVSVSKVDADPPSTVVATVTYRRGDQTAVERTSFRVVEDDGVLKIAASSVLGGG